MSDILDACQAAKHELWLWRSPMSTLAHLSQWTYPPGSRSDDVEARETMVPLRTSGAVFMPDPTVSIMWGIHLETWVRKSRTDAPSWAKEPLPFALPWDSDGAAILLNGVPIWEVQTASVALHGRGQATIARPRELLAEGERPWVMTWEVEFARLVSRLSSSALHDEIWGELVAGGQFDVRDTDPLSEHASYL